MIAHLRANLWLLVLTRAALLRAVPAGAAGRRPDRLPRPGQGSLIDATADSDGKAVGSRLIAQPFTRRRVLPAAAVGGVLQRRRLRRQQLRRRPTPAARPRRPALGPIVKYRGTAGRSARTSRRGSATPDARPWRRTDRRRSWPRWVKAAPDAERRRG